MPAAKRKFEKAFWEMKAKRYPMPFAEEPLAKTNKVMALVQAHGIEFTGAHILDLGCGTGNYTLPLAQQAAWVTGLDVSKIMLARLQKESARVGLKNVTAVQASWQGVTLGTFKWEKAFDIVWSAMSPAVGSQETLDKMMQCARRWCVYIGWGRKRSNPVLEEAFSLHGMKFGPAPGAQKVDTLLSAASIPHTLEYLDTSWEWIGSVEETVEDISGHIRLQDGEPDQQALREMLGRQHKNGIIRHTTQVEQGVIVWRV